MLISATIKTKSQIGNGNDIGPELKKLLMHFSEAKSQNPQKSIKQNMAHILRQNGFQPQEIRSFLEGLTRDSGKALSTRGDIKPNVIYKMVGFNYFETMLLENYSLLFSQNCSKSFSILNLLYLAYGHRHWQERKPAWNVQQYLMLDKTKPTVFVEWMKGL